MILILIFGEVLGLYGYVTIVIHEYEFDANCDRLIVGLILNSKSHP